MMKIIESVFENILWKSRLFVLFAIIFALLGSITLFIVSSIDIYSTAAYVYTNLVQGLHPEDFHKKIVSGIIGAVDLYLIAIVMLIFAFGLYELFISEIDVAKNSGGSKLLEVTSLDQLKDKLAKVIVMVLIVSFFQRILYTEFHNAMDMMYFALSILGLCLGLYFLHKGGEHAPTNKHTKEVH